MTIQVFIEGQDHADIVKQVRGLAEAFGVAWFTVPAKHVNTAQDPEDPEKEPPQPSSDLASDKRYPDSSTGRGWAKVPSPTQATVRLASEMGVDLDTITSGSGKDGRVTQADVKAAAKAAPVQTSEGPSAEPEPPEEPATVPAADPFADDTPEASIEPTKENATAALRVVHGEKGMDACMAVLKEMGASRISDVPAEKYGEFIAKCGGALAINEAGLQQKISELAA